MILVIRCLLIITAWKLSHSDTGELYTWVEQRTRVQLKTVAVRCIASITCLLDIPLLESTTVISEALSLAMRLLRTNEGLFEDINVPLGVGPHGFCTATAQWLQNNSLVEWRSAMEMYSRLSEACVPNDIELRRRIVWVLGTISVSDSCLPYAKTSRCNTFSPSIATEAALLMLDHFRLSKIACDVELHAAIVTLCGKMPGEFPITQMDNVCLFTGFAVCNFSRVALSTTSTAISRNTLELLLAHLSAYLFRHASSFYSEKSSDLEKKCLESVVSLLLALAPVGYT